MSEDAAVRTARLVAILLMLPSRGRVTAGEVAAETAADTRCVPDR